MRVNRTMLAVVVAVLAVAGAVTAVTLPGSRGPLDEIPILLTIAAYAVVGLAVALARPGHAVGVLMLAGAATWGVGEALLEGGLALLDQGAGSRGAVLVAILGTVARGAGWLVLVLALPLVFPDGRSPWPRARWVVVGCGVGFAAGSLLAPYPLDTRLAAVPNPVGLPDRLKVVADLLAVGSLALAFVALAVAVRALVRRWRTGGELVRQQVLVFGVAFTLPLLMLALAATGWARPWMFALVTLPVPLAVAVAMFQRRLYDVQLAANRTLTYLALSACLAGLYAAVIAGVGVVLQERGATWLPWVAAGVVAVAFAPLRESLQRTVNRITYGRWSTPAEVLADTGRRLADAAGGAALLDGLTHELVHGLGLRGATIVDATSRELARSGVPEGLTDRLQLTAYGRPVGELLWTGHPLRPVDRELLADLAHQIGGAVHTVGLVEALQEAQERLVIAREQERRRLRHDLHDGLGPSLAGLGFQLDAVQNLLDAGEPVEHRLAALRAGLSDTVTEVRRIVEGLRPPAIDDLGLYGAVAELGHDLAEGAGLRLDLDLPDQRPVLPAAVEVAAYRVAQEALTNVVRHSGAATCRIVCSVTDDVLLLEVADDGRGGAAPGRGLGIPGMRDRAREIGGDVDVRAGSDGTAVLARLPLRAEARA